MTAFTGKYDSCNEYSDEDISAEELVETYRHFLTEWKESFFREDKQKKTISDLILEK